MAAGLRAGLERVAPVPAAVARVDVAFFAVLRFAVERFAVERFAAVFRPPLALFAAPLLREVEDELEPELVLALVSIVHLPDITR